ncbi:MAG: RNA polymerase sigma factor [Candidatus Cyclobacteriaceae bacterium M3_2C_046]
MQKYQKYPVKQLTTLLKDGDIKAFDEIYHRFVPRVLGFLSRVYKDQELAKEVTQEVFIKIWEVRQVIQPEKSFEAYLFQIAKNKIYDLLQQQKRKYEVYQKIIPDDLSNEVEDEILLDDLKQQVSQVVNKLPDSQKEIFLLSREQLLSNEEIARQLQISRRTVETQLYRVLKKLKKELAKNELIYLYIVWFLL